jgi:hypothetical protein
MVVLQYPGWRALSFLDGAGRHCGCYSQPIQVGCLLLLVVQGHMGHYKRVYSPAKVFVGRIPLQSLLALLHLGHQFRGHVDVAGEL